MGKKSSFALAELAFGRFIIDNACALETEQSMEALLVLPQC